MLDKIFDLVRSHAGNAVTSNTGIPQEKNDEVIRAGGDSIISTLKGALASGKLNDVLAFFKGNNADSPIVKEATGNYSTELQSRFGLNPAEASNVAGSVIPSTMTDLAKKTTDPGDNSFNIQDIFNQLSGGKTGGLDIQNLLSRFGGSGLDKDKDGDVDLKDLASMFGGGGAGGVIGGLFK